jgi:multiple antibiotic resistance protein
VNPDTLFALFAFTSLLAIVNPISAATIFFALESTHAPINRHATVRRAVVAAATMLIIFAACGTWVLTLFGITIPAFKLAGALLFVRMGVEMVSSVRHNDMTPEEEGEAVLRADLSITPLATPVLAGPGALATTLALVAQAKSPVQVGSVYLAIICVMGASWGALLWAPTIIRKLGHTGSNILQRIEGLLCVVIGFQFAIDAFRVIAQEIATALLSH